jgi:hypothetical protein
MLERERFLLNELARGRPSREEFIAAFLRPPVYSLAFDRRFGTLWPAVYAVGELSLQLRWPGGECALPVDYPRIAPVIGQS